MARLVATLCSVPEEPKPDWRLTELRQLGEAERRLELELGRMRREIAALIVELLPHHANQAKINEVVVASGFSRTLIEAVRGGGAMWTSL